MREYLLSVGGYTFRCVHIVFEEDNFEILQVGFLGDEGWCIEFNYESIQDPKVIKMVSVVHNRKCSVEENMESGDGTRKILKAAIVFAFKVFSKASVISFHDASQISCTVNGVSIQVDLPIMKMLTEGVTWYEKYFHAKPEDDWSFVRNKKEQFRALSCKDFALRGSHYWKQVSPEKSIVYSKWYIERGANRCPIEITETNSGKLFVGGYKRKGVLL